MEDALSILAAHFGNAHTEGAPRKVWWRDDDATRPTRALERLGRCAHDAGATLAVAAIPEATGPALLREAEANGWHVLQHGIAHTNHAAAGKAVELGGERGTHDVIADLTAARQKLLSAAFVPVLVPPWNRIRGDIVPRLALAGYRGLSRYGGPLGKGPLIRCDSHIDPIDWRGSRSLAPPETLAAMARAAVAVEGPIGLLTHHLDHDAPISAFVSAFADLVAGHPGAEWTSAAEIFGAP